MRSTYSRRKKCQPGSTWRMWRSGSSLRPQLSGSEGPAAARTNGPISPMIIGPTFGAPGRGQLRASRAGTQRGGAPPRRGLRPRHAVKPSWSRPWAGARGGAASARLDGVAARYGVPQVPFLEVQMTGLLGELVIAADRALAGARHRAG